MKTKISEEGGAAVRASCQSYTSQTAVRLKMIKRKNTLHSESGPVYIFGDHNLTVPMTTCDYCRTAGTCYSMYYIVNTCRPDKHNSGTSPPPLADSLLMLSLNTSAFVVITRGPKPGHRKDN